MKLIDAIEIVIALAQDNVLEIYPGDGKEEVDERFRQLEAIATLEDFAVNHLGED